MQLINFLTFKPLEAVRREMKAPLVKPIFIHKLKSRYHTNGQFLGEEELEIDSLDTLKIHLDGTLTYNDKRVLLYIVDLSDDPLPPVFHISSCHLLQELNTRGKIFKYYITSKEDGLFFGEPLGVCKECLTFLNWSGYTQTNRRGQEKIAANFTSRSFFKNI